MRCIKRAIPFYTSAPIDALPVEYWRILFPQPYWSTIKSESSKNGLDPYMVASLIRQESEFNPGAISPANAYGLMQLLPSVGRSMAKEEGIHHFHTDDLLNPETNIRLGTRYLRQTLNKFNSQPEYTFAAYNAGDNRVTDWQSIGNYSGMDEFVESIPFTETREYVQAIIRNEQIYREIDHASTAEASASTTH
jgi:soluble lytic murein transglycosylase